MLEFALIVPLLFLLLVGIVEGGWALAQTLEIRHGAREAARLAAVDFGDEAAIAVEVCDRMSLPTQNPSITLTEVAAADPAVKADVSINLDPLTGLLGGLFSGAVSASVEMRLEAAPSWADSTTPCP